MIIEPATIEEMGIPTDWAAGEGWNPGLTDAVPFHAADSRGFLIGRVDGVPVATISAVRYPGDFGFIGFYIVHPEWRGQGFGWQIWQAAMERLAGCNIALDGVLAEQERYRRSGFRLAWRNIRYEGIADTPADDPAVTSFTSLADLCPGVLSAFDRRYFPADRTSFLQAWVRQPGTLALGLLERGEPAAYGVIRPCRTGYKIGPLCARSRAPAGQLFRRLRSAVAPGQRFYLDVPAPNAAAVALAEGAGMRPVFETARMYTAAPPDLPLGEIYGITSFELG